MSKKNQKQNDDDPMQEKIKEYMKFIMEKNFQNQHAFERISRLEKDQNSCDVQYSIEKNQYLQKIQDRDQVIKYLESQNTKYKDLVIENENKMIEAQDKLKQDNLQNQEKISQMEQEFQYQLNLQDNTISDLNLRLAQQNKFKKEKQSQIQKFKELEEKLQKQEFNQDRILADKNRDFIISQDSLKKNMLFQISDIRKQMMTVKQDQFDSTIRLTMLQNQQLSQELEYQSKQTEKVLLQNSKLEQQLSNYKKEIEIHKLIQFQIIDKQKQQETQNDQKHDRSKSQFNNENSEFSNGFQKQKEEIIKQHDKQQNYLQKKYQKLQNDYDILKSQYEISNNQDSQKKACLQNLAHIIYEYLQSCNAEDTKDLVYKLNIQQIKKNQLTTQDKEALLYIILNQIKSIVNINNLLVKNQPNIQVFVQENNSFQIPKVFNIQKLKISEVKLSPSQNQQYYRQNRNKSQKESSTCRFETIKQKYNL